MRDTMDPRRGGRLFGLWLVWAIVWPFSGIADDTEIYATSYAKAGQPNLLFVLDSSGSMKEALEGDANGIRSRYLVMREVLEDVLASVPDTVNVGLLNYGGHKEKAQANGIRYPVTSLSPKDKDGKPIDKNVRADILAEIDKFKVEGYTPIVQSLYEAALYFRGEGVDYGASGTAQRLAHPDSYTASGTPVVVEPGQGETKECNKTKGECPATVDPANCTKRYEFFCAVGVPGDCPADIASRATCRLVNVPASTYEEKVCQGGYDEAGNCSHLVTVTRQIEAHQNYECLTEMCTYQDPGSTRFKVEGAVYRSPIKQECQTNYLVLMSDGEPDDGLSLAAGDTAEHDPAIIEKLRDKFNISGCKNNGDGQCGPELTDYLANVDQRPGLKGKQTIATYTIAFAVEPEGQAFLRKLANLGEEAEANGESGFFTAANRAQLRAVFNTIVSNIAVVNHDLAIPTISVDPETGLTHGEDVFFPFFRPDISPRWPGNLKKYRLKREEEGLVVVDSLDRPVYDEDGNPLQRSRSFWLPADDPADGADITAGGAARLLEGNRTIFTSNEDDELTPLTAENVEPDWFGDAGLDEAEMLAFAYGQDATVADTELKYRHEMGDILHSSPVIVPYGNGPDLIFVATNEGFLHAIDTETGREKFAFIPRELLPVLNIRKENAFDEPHPYGLDGFITVWKDEQKVGPNDNGVTGKTYLVVGMRRGGVNYYALDITDPDAPSLAWVIRGQVEDKPKVESLNQSSSDATNGFEDLGQTWSRAIPATVYLPGENGGEKHQPVFIFSGGYNPDYDQPDPDRHFADKIKGGEGNTLFIVNARTGKKLWQADFGSVASIPADPRVIDIDGNGVADRIYIVDIEGRLFRIDLPDPAIKHVALKVSEPRIVQLADLGSDGNKGARIGRRFYNEPDAALVAENGRKYITISLGSGYRAHPLMKGKDIDQDYLFVIKDRNVYQLPPDKEDSAYRLTKPADLRLVGKGANKGANKPKRKPTDFGWALPLDKAGGEKALARAVTLKNVVYFTTFQPETEPAADLCSNATHTGRVYGMDVRSGKPALRFVDVDEPKLSVEFTTTDIPSEVVLVASRYEETRPGGRTVSGVKFDILGNELKGLVPPTFSGLNKQYWEVRRKSAAAAAGGSSK